MRTNKTNSILIPFLVVMLFVAGCKDKEEVIPTAVITSISEQYGMRGSTLTITGSDFHSSTVVYFGDVVATPVSVDATTIVVAVPSDAVTGKISITQDGKSTEGPSYHVYTPAKNLYFTQFYAKTIEKVDLVNTPSASVSLYGDADSIASPVGITLSDDGFLYVTGAYSSEIYKMPSTPSGSVEVLYGFDDGVDFPSSIVFDHNTDMVYWPNVGSKQFMKALANGTGSPTALFNGDEVLSDAYGLKINFETGDMYYSDDSYIKKINIDGSGAPDVLYGPTEWPDMTFPSNIVIDLPRGKIYWTDEGSTQIVEANLDGSGIPEILFDEDDGLLYVVGVAVDYASGEIYWTDDNHGKIFKGNLNGTGTPEVLVDAENSYGMTLEFEE